MQITMSHPEHGEQLVYLDDIAAKKIEGWSEVLVVTGTIEVGGEMIEVIKEKPIKVKTIKQDTIIGEL